MEVQRLTYRISAAQSLAAGMAFLAAAFPFGVIEHGRYYPGGYRSARGHGGKHTVKLPRVQRRARRKAERHRRHCAQRRLRPPLIAA